MSDQAKLDQEQPYGFPGLYIAKVKQVLTSFWQHLKHNLSASQKMYLAAFILLVLALQEDDSVFEGITFTGCLALAAMFSEVWPRFVKVWETLLGRVFIVLFYAIIANLAVAIAAQKVNEVVGIDPSPLFYTLGFTTVLLAPLWFLGLTAVSMIGYMVFLQIWLVIVFLLKLIRVPIYRHKSQLGMSHPVLTNVFRIALIPVMLSSLAAVAEVYMGDIDYGSLSPSNQHVSRMSNNIKETVLNQAVKDSGQPLAEEEKAALNDVFNTVESELKRAEEVLAQPASNSAVSDSLASNSKNDAPEQDEAGKVDDDDNSSDKKLSTLIAWFVHNIETFQFSQCVKADDERAVYIGETDILVSRENPEAPFGVEFSARTCELNVKK